MAYLVIALCFLSIAGGMTLYCSGSREIQPMMCYLNVRKEVRDCFYYNGCLFIMLAKLSYENT